MRTHVVTAVMLMSFGLHPLLAQDQQRPPLRAPQPAQTQGQSSGPVKPDLSTESQNQRTMDRRGRRDARRRSRDRGRLGHPSERNMRGSRTGSYFALQHHSPSPSSTGPFTLLDARVIGRPPRPATRTQAAGASERAAVNVLERSKRSCSTGSARSARPDVIRKSP